MTLRKKTTAGNPAAGKRPLQSAVNAVKALKPAERAKMLAESDDSAALVPALPPEDLLFTLRAADREEAALILAHARPSQISFVLSMEIWDGDEVSPVRARRWLEMVGELDDKRLERLLKGLALTDLAALTGRVAFASLADEEGQPEKDDADGLVSFTLDGTHYITAPASSSATMKKLLLLLRNADQSKYHRMLELLLTGFTVEDEETAAHLRRAAIAERGFLETPDAMRIYGRLETSVFETKTKKRRATEKSLKSGSAAPVYPLAIADRPGRLREILDNLAEDKDDDSIRRQLAHLINLAVSADGMDIAETESFAAAARKVYGYLTIGLEALHGADEKAMEETLRDHWLEDIFRVGATEVALAREAARSFLKKGPPGGYRDKLDFLGEAHKNTLLALTKPRPRHFEETPDGGSERDFASLAEVRKAKEAVMGAELVFSLFEAKLGTPAESLETGGGRPEAPALLVTALLNSAMGRAMRPEPMTPGEARQAMGLFGKKDSTEARTLVERAASWACGGLKPDGPERTFMAGFVKEAFRRFFEEAALLPPEEEPDARFFTSIAIT